jgi:hypothetical protein
MEAYVDPASPGSFLDAEHPGDGVLIPRRLTFVRLGRYITDVKAEGRSTAAERLAAYVIDAAHDGEKVAWSRVSNCGSDDPRLALLQIKNCQARNTRAQNKTLHLVVSFPEGERPTDAQLHAIEDKLCAALGMADHQRLSALHVNTVHAHLHVALNRIHPETFKCVDPSFGQRKLMAACHDLEIAYGLERTNHGLGRDDATRTPVRGRAADMEAQTGRQSFAGWVQETARDALLAAKDTGQWDALHHAAAAHGLVLTPRGAGLVITDAEGIRAVKASAVDRGLSLPALTAACGPYQPAPQGLEPARSAEAYAAKPVQNHGKAQALFATYQVERDAAQQARTRQTAALRDRQRAYRRELADWHREERRKLREGWLESLSPDKGARYRELDKQRDRLMERSRAEEKAARTKIHAAHPLPGWPDWLQARAGRGDTEALAVLRSREDRSQRLTASLLRAETAGEAATLVLTARRPVVGRDGSVAYRLPDGGLVRDEAAKVVVAQESRAAAVLALTLAARRFGERPLVVEGSPEFRGWVAEAARLPGIRARFADPAFEAARSAAATKTSPERDPAGPLPDHAARPGGRQEPTVPAAEPSQPWSSTLTGEFTYLGLRDGAGGPSLLWQQGDQLFAQPATRQAQQAARDVEPGDVVLFSKGGLYIVRGPDTGHDGGRDTGFGR